MCEESLSSLFVCALNKSNPKVFLKKLSNLFCQTYYGIKRVAKKLIILCFLGKVHGIIKSLSENRLRPVGRERR